MTADVQNAMAPFQLGERVMPANLFGWNYTGLSGTPGELGASRRYTKGMWVLELMAHADRKRSTKVTAMRTQTEDEHWWADKARS